MWIVQLKLIPGLFLLFFLAACKAAPLETSNGYSETLFSAHHKITVAIATDSKDDTAAMLGVKPTEGNISSQYGMRKLRGKKTRLHKGIDITASRGSSVLASGEGKVVFAGRRSTFGNLVEIEHEDGTLTRYAHLEKILVKRGETVQPGAKLGTVGRTGRVTGYNLHFEVLRDNKPVDPLSVVDWA